uniref:Transposase n=1 Tax=Roseihalotalea indica TaxID=2867963 RepID=A0AA49JF11_9BACT|nr:transposase [Tunicatimonas sp. TK19036]
MNIWITHPSYPHIHTSIATTAFLEFYYNTNLKAANRKDTYKKRASVEQSIGWLKECRRIATRYEKLAISFSAMIKLAFIRYYLKTYLSDTA